MKNSLILLLLFGLPGTSIAQSPAANVVAVVGDEKITLDEFNKRYEEVRRMSGGSAPSKGVFLEDLVRYRIGLQEAEKRGLRNDPIIQERLRQELYKGFIEKELGSVVEKIQITDAELRAYYKDNPEIRASHILFEVRPGASDEQRAIARKRGQEILAEVQKSKRPFEELVNLYTDDSLTKATGGDLGYQTRLTFQPQVYNALVRLSVGGITDLVETERGFHILKLTGKRAYNDATKTMIRAAVYDEKRKDLFDNLFKRLKSKYKIQTNPSLLK